MPAVASFVISVRIVISGASKYPKPTAMIMVESRCKGFKSFWLLQIELLQRQHQAMYLCYINGSNEAVLIVTAVAAAVVVGSGIINPTVVLFVWFVVVYRCPEERDVLIGRKTPTSARLGFASSTASTTPELRP